MYWLDTKDREVFHVEIIIEKLNLAKVLCRSCFHTDNESVAGGGDPLALRNGGKEGGKEADGERGRPRGNHHDHEDVQLPAIRTSIGSEEGFLYIP
jgi:hypothetical protein